MHSLNFTNGVGDKGTRQVLGYDQSGPLENKLDRKRVGILSPEFC